MARLYYLIAFTSIALTSVEVVKILYPLKRLNSGKPYFRRRTEFEIAFVKVKIPFRAKTLKIEFSENFYFSTKIAKCLFLNWASPGLFLSSFSSFLFSFFYIQTIVSNFPDDRIRTSDLWCRKWPLYQLCQSHLPLFMFLYLSSHKMGQWG